MKSHFIKLFSLTVFIAAIAISFTPNSVSAGACATSTHKDYASCVQYYQTIESSIYGTKSNAAWCSGCNQGWTAAEYKECEDTAMDFFIKECDNYFNAITCPDGQTQDPTTKECIDNTPAPTPDPVDDGKAKNDSDCQAEYGLAYFDETSSTNCRCNIPDAKMNPASGKCEYTWEYYNRECMTKYGPAFYDENNNKCECHKLTEWSDSEQKCVAFNQLELEAMQELQLAFYYHVATMGLLLGGEHHKAANIAYGLSIDDHNLDSRELDHVMMERRNMYMNMSKWQLGYKQTVKKAIGILKGKTVTIGRVEVRIEDEGTVAVMINDNWLYLLTGKVKIDDTDRKINVYTPSGGMARPKATSYTVEYNEDSGESTIEVLEGSVDVLSPKMGAYFYELSTGDSETLVSNDEIGAAIDKELGISGDTSGTNSGTTESCFSDISNHAYKDAICYVKNENIVQGYDDGTYKPDQFINRAEFTKIMMVATFSADELTGTNCFKDVGYEWYANPICTAKEMSVIGGYPDGTFGPAKNINLAEALKIIIEAAFSANGETIPASTGAWYQVYVDLANEIGMIDTINQDPGHFLTRGEMAEMVYRGSQ